jgi:glycosyltransferase involved in cell wall biosynthesis
MNIAFYAPLKPPDHPVPSGDRQMARLLIRALNSAGHDVEIASTLRSFMPEPTLRAVAELQAMALSEVERISDLWHRRTIPDHWFSYHSYYKAPDLIGPALASKFRIPYATVEASYSRRRNVDGWTETQERVVEAVRAADINFCFTQRDRAGLAAVAPAARLETLAPFIDTTPYTSRASPDHPGRLVTVAMMRKGDKFESFKMLAEALYAVLDMPWTLSVVGDGNMRKAVAELFCAMPAGRIEWLGQVEPDHVPTILRTGGIYVWPGFGEAYGLAYLEAQAAGLPVVAQETAGVPEVVQNGVTGILTRRGEVREFAAAVRLLLTSHDCRKRMAAAAHRFVCIERSMQQAALTLNGALERSTRRRQNER